ncbi:kinetochore protein Spc25-like [Littorina saxatilis]|uniref:Kinetochore protein SPC25 n=1 Tax=Littorina saxatilis TaxID=31220 RepID=A0AAN9GJ12_9CAEN
MTMDIREELPKLKSMLSMTSSKMDRWFGEEKHSILRENQAQVQAVEEAKRDLPEKAGRLQTLHKELTALTSTVDTHIHEKELVAEEQEHARHSIEKEQELLLAQEKTVDEKLKELRKGVELFKDRLGLSFKKTTGNRLQIVFTNIDHKDPDCPFYFFLQVDNGKYIISDCEPPVPDLDALVEKLNSSNNLRSFVVAIRKHFKKLVQK